MFHFFKKKPFTIDCFVNEDYAGLVEYAPIRRSSYFIPEWFKKLDKSSTIVNSINDKPYVKNNLTARGCLGIINTLTSGFIIPMWSDLYFSVRGDECTYQFSDLKSSMDVHDNAQAKGFMEDHNIFKLVSPWMIMSSKPMKYIHQPCVYQNYMPEYNILPGINQSLTRNNITITNTFITPKKLETESQYYLKFNTPLVQYIPLTEEPYKLNIDILSNNEYLKYYNIYSETSVFTNNGLLKRRSMPVCPFKGKK